MVEGNGQKPKPGVFLECQVKGKKCGHKAPTVHDLEVHLKSVHGLTR